MNLSGAAAKPLAGENDLAQNPFDLAAEYGPSLFDARHRLVASASWMPTVSPRAPAAVRAIFGGWQLNGDRHAQLRHAVHGLGFGQRRLAGEQPADLRLPGQPAQSGRRSRTAGRTRSTSGSAGRPFSA